jgi:lauroyl/myristoyl acyltransferase
MDEAISTAPPLAPKPALKPAGPSSFYRGGVWKFALAASRTMPTPAANLLAITAVHAYRFAQPKRRRIIFENLLPVFKDDPRGTGQATTRLYSRFATKLVDLFRFEAGVSMYDRFTLLHNWEAFAKPFARGNGVLMVTPHLGNWEIGSELMVRKGVKFFAVTQPEPGSDFTAIRARARAQRGIETIVVGQDAFSVLEIIKRLQEGAAVAMLIDRPFGASGVEVDLFGRKYCASIAAAELARASGCAIVGGCIVEENGGYAARFMPEFEYDRRALGNREGRRELTQRLMSAFEPMIRVYADQWYQFVPVWPKL